MDLGKVIILYCIPLKCTVSLATPISYLVLFISRKMIWFSLNIPKYSYNLMYIFPLEHNTPVQYMYLLFWCNHCNFQTWKIFKSHSRYLLFQILSVIGSCWNWTPTHKNSVISLSHTHAYTHASRDETIQIIQMFYIVHKTRVQPGWTFSYCFL